MEQRFSHISGDGTLDLINTVEWRLGGPDREEDLDSYADVLAWCRESGLISADEAATLATLSYRDAQRASAEHRSVIALREATYSALFETDDAAAQVVADAHREALAHARLTAVGPRWTWGDEAADLALPRRRIARALIDLLGREDLDRLHQCEDAKCGWVYLDLSPRRNRRWCVASDCGDRNRARAYYARKKQR